MFEKTKQIDREGEELEQEIEPKEEEEVNQQYEEEGNLIYFNKGENYDKEFEQENLEIEKARKKVKFNLDNDGIGGNS